MMRNLIERAAGSLVVGVVIVMMLCVTVSPALAAGPLPDIQKGTISVHLNPIATNMAAPDYAISPPNDPRLFVVEQNGQLRIIENGALQPTISLNLATTGPGLGPFNPAVANDERGFLGLAFHPNFHATPTTPGYQTLYTYSSAPIATPTYVAPNGATQNYQLTINEWKMSAADPNVVDPASRREIMSFGKNAGNHNGGTITFGPDGYMYLALGDGGNANDVGASHIEPYGNAQNFTTPLGKMIRIDPLHPSLTPNVNPASTNGQYRIPADNPVMDASQTVPEIYAAGLRNPYRFAFDRGGTNDLILADVGQNNIEEIDRIVKGGNYGWATKEGTFLFNRVAGPGGDPAAGTIGPHSPGTPANAPPGQTFIDPILGTEGYLQYDHDDGISITGGFVYRGDDIPELFGKYVFGDLALRNLPPRVDGRLFYADLEDGTIHEFLLPQFAAGVLPDGLTVHGFGQDNEGELYALVTNTPANGTGGIVYKFEVPEPGSALTVLGLGALGMVRRRRA